MGVLRCCVLKNSHVVAIELVSKYARCGIIVNSKVCECDVIQYNGHNTRLKHLEFLSNL
jgi:hypothetical protein